MVEKYSGLQLLMPLDPLQLPIALTVDQQGLQTDAPSMSMLAVTLRRQDFKSRRALATLTKQRHCLGCIYAVPCCTFSGLYTVRRLCTCQEWYLLLTGVAFLQVQQAWQRPWKSSSRVKAP